MYVEKRGNKYKFVERYTIAGVSRRVSVTLDRDTPQARKKAQELLKQRSITYRSDITYQELVAAYIEYQKKNNKPSTYIRNETALARLGFADLKADKMTAGIIKKYLDDHYEKPTTKNEYIKRLRAMFRWGFQNDLLTSKNVIDKLTYYKAPPHREKIKDKFLETSELKEVLNHATPYFRNFFEFLALSGLRVGEATALLDSDVTDSISVTKSYDYHNKLTGSPKTYSSNRQVHIQPELAECIKRIRIQSARNRELSRKHSDLFFVNPYGNCMSYWTANREFKKLCGKYAPRENPLTLHALRHTHVSLMAENGIPLPVISRRLGHADSRITEEVYFHVTKKAAENEARLFDSINILGTSAPFLPPEQ